MSTTMTDKTTETFGQRLLALRTAKGLTQRQLAHAASRLGEASINHDVIGNWERGTNTNPMVLQILPVAKALGVTVEWLMTGEQA